METRRSDTPERGTATTSSSSSPPFLQPNYNNKAVKEALEHLATIELIELCSEAKVERCRASRDLRSCGRYVRHVLNSCGHASLCYECSQRCDFCPICRVPIPKTGNNCLRLRLYYECIEAGLISKTYDDRFLEKEDGEKQLAADVQRLYLFFDVAMENNLVSLICHYVTDICMDESAVSSDPVIAFLVDEVAVKEWCKRKFGSIITDLRAIYILEQEEMKTRVSILQKFSLQLTGISYVLEVLESSIKGTPYAQQDLHHLQDNVLKAKQHLEIMTWCIKKQFVENIKSRYINYTSWCSHFRERKHAATTRSWPDLISNSSDSTQLDSPTLFIEDALSNLEMEQEHGQEISKEVEVTSLVKDGGSSSFLKSKIAGFAGSYPFENLRAAADILFLFGSSDLVVAKRAIFLYYLFDRHWTLPDTQWRYLMDDFAASFGITRQSLLESLTFYLLDDHTDQALQEACRLLPEIAGPNTHPKIAQVLLERQNPDAALMVLRWSGRDGLCAYANSVNGGAQLVSLREAVIAVRVRFECGLLTEAFMYQRTHCLQVKEDKLKRGPSRAVSNNSPHESWGEQMEVLVTEICCLCIRRNLVDRMIELPWSSDEEKYLHKCLLEYATEDPSTTSGSLLVVFYLQRFRYIEAHQIDHKLQNLEQDLISKASISEEVVSRIRSTSQWRAGLVDKCIELLPDVQQQLVKTGSLPDFGPPAKESEIHLKSDFLEEQPPNSASVLPSSLVLNMNSTIYKKTSAFETPAKLGGSISNSSRIEFGNNRSPSTLHEKFLNTPVGGPSTPFSKSSLVTNHLSARELKYQSGIRQSFKSDDVATPGIHHVSPGIMPLKEVNRSSSRVLHNDYVRDFQSDKHLTGIESNLFTSQAENRSSPYQHRPSAYQISTPSSNLGLSKGSAQYPNSMMPGKRSPSDRPWMGNSRDDSMDFTWSSGNKDSTVEHLNMNGGPRWRSDESSEDDEEPSPEKRVGGGSTIQPVRVRGGRKVL